MQIQNSTPSDQATIFELYELATAVQRSKSPAVVVWPTFEQALVATEIAEGEHAQANGKAYIRMDTCGNNQGLIKYYTARGFAFLGIHKLKSSKGLPAHYQDADVCFFEIKL